MAEQAKSELATLRAEHKALFGKNPAPNLDADALRAKIAAGKAEAPSAPAPAPVPAADAPIAPSGAALLDHEDPDASATYMGTEIVRGKNRLFLVPLHAVEELLAHGFTLVSGAE